MRENSTDTVVWGAPGIESDGSIEGLLERLYKLRDEALSEPAREPCDWCGNTEPEYTESGAYTCVKCA